MLTKQEVLDYLGVSDDDPIIDSLMVAADEYLKGAVGADYPKDNEKAKLIAKVFIHDIYSNRGTATNNAKLSSAIQGFMQSMLLQLRIEIRGDGDG